MNFKVFSSLDIYRDETDEFKKFVMRILRLKCSLFGYEKKRSTFEMIIFKIQHLNLNHNLLYC